MRLSLFFQTSLQCEIRFALDMLRFSLASSLRLFAGGHRGVVTPVPIPNTEVKGSFAEGSVGLARARVGRTPLATAPRLAALGGYSGFFISLNLERLATS